jgi:hypothetical protein
MSECGLGGADTLDQYRLSIMSLVQNSPAAELYIDDLRIIKLPDSLAVGDIESGTKLFHPPHPPPTSSYAKDCDCGAKEMISLNVQSNKNFDFLVMCTSLMYTVTVTIIINIRDLNIIT